MFSARFNRSRRASLLLLGFSLVATAGLAQDTNTIESSRPGDEKSASPKTASRPDAPIVRQRILEKPVHRSVGLRLVDGMKFPLHQLGKGFDSGLRRVEKDHVMERTQDLQAAIKAKGIEPLFGGLGNGAGFSFGLNTPRKNFLGTGARLDIPLQYSTNRYVGLGVSLTYPFANNKFSLKTGFDYQDRREEDFFGIGPQSSEENRSNFRLQRKTFTLALETRLKDNLVLSFPFTYSDANIFEGKDNVFPDLQEQFNPTEIPGVTGANLYSLGTSLDWNYLNHPTLPTAGGRVQVGMAYFWDSGNQNFRFLHTNLEAVHYVPLDDEHVVVFRALGVFNDEKGTATVPFTQKTMLGGLDTMRGFREFRFLDDNAILLNVEYRWQIWKFADMVLFVDEGQVAPEPGGFSISDFRNSHGFGLRFRSEAAQVLRIDAGHSKEGWRIYVSYGFSF